MPAGPGTPPASSRARDGQRPGRVVSGDASDAGGSRTGPLGPAGRRASDAEASSAAFEKARPGAPSGFYEAEAAGLRWLREAGGARVVGVVAVTPGRILLERITSVRPDPVAAHAVGAALARTHAAGAPAFGCPPDGTEGPLFIGSRPLPAARASRWGAFYAQDRVLPYLGIGVAAGSVSPSAERLVRDACDLVATGVLDGDEPPSRIHGDLWNGNVMWSPDGAVLIDPAAHGGHRETDLAMLELFGCPFLGDVLRGYREEATALGRPLPPSWRERIPLHQLHPLAVHAAGHGPSYGRALQVAAEQVLQLAT
jgi:fructosamine-3-kinase